MRFKEYIDGANSGEIDPKTKAQLAFDFAIGLGYPCVCSISTAVFTHGDLVFDPTVGSNLGFYADASGLFRIAPYIAKRHRQTSNFYWFDQDINPIPIIKRTVSSWILFSLNPYKYYGQTFHLMGVKPMSDGSFATWDTAVSKSDEELNKNELWSRLQGHIYGDKPVLITFED